MGLLGWYGTGIGYAVLTCCVVGETGFYIEALDYLLDAARDRLGLPMLAEHVLKTLGDLGPNVGIARRLKIIHLVFSALKQPHIITVEKAIKCLLLCMVLKGMSLL